MNCCLTTFCCLTILAMSGAAARADDPVVAAEQGVVMEVRIGDETTRFEPLEVAEPITVETLMKRLAERDEKFRFEARGSSETCFVTSILGHRNEGRGGRNWLLMVDGKLADRGAGSFKVGPGKIVVWQYRGGGPDR